ncbi:MurR/RpiR family transcriptional regulator [Arthrobacter pigmenti]
MLLNGLVRSMNGALSDSERRVVNALLEAPTEMAELPAKQVAERVDVHESTVIRLARRLGYTGYTQLREDLRSDDTPNTSLDRMQGHADDSFDLASLAAEEIAALQRLSHMVPQGDIDEVAKAILKAGTTFIFGPPYAQAVLDLLARRLTRLGLRAVPLPTSGRLAAERMTSMQQDDLIISFVFRRPDPRLDSINAYAQDTGARTVVIADEEGLNYRSVPDQLIVARRGPTNDLRSLIVPFFLCYAIQMALLHAAPEEMNQKLAKLDEIARIVGNDEASHAF